MSHKAGLAFSPPHLHNSARDAQAALKEVTQTTIAQAMPLGPLPHRRFGMALESGFVFGIDVLISYPCLHFHLNMPEVFYPRPCIFVFALNLCPHRGTVGNDSHPTQ